MSGLAPEKLSIPPGEGLIPAFEEAHSRTRLIFERVDRRAYYETPIPLRHPIVFYDGHIDAFIWNVFFRKVLGQGALNETFDRLFARGIDPPDAGQAARLNHRDWPDRSEVEKYRSGIFSRFVRFLAEADGEALRHPLLKDGHLFYLLLEHELMHQETLLYMIHQLPHHLKRPLEGYEPAPELSPVPVKPYMVGIPEGAAVLGAFPGEFDFGWDNEFPRTEIPVPAFYMDAYPVTNGEFLAFVEAGGYRDRRFWREESWAWKCKNSISHPFFWNRSGDGWLLKDFFHDRPLPLQWPVFVTQAEAAAFAVFAGKSLPSEAQWHRAAYGPKQDRPYPWGDAEPCADHGNFHFRRWSPAPVGSCPGGATPEGIHDLAGGGWEWTRTPFLPLDGFRASEAYPEYSADFFDGRHYVLKGGSCFTDRRLMRRSFRNWFYGHYPYVYATFRCVAR